MQNRKPINRRSFLQGAAAVTAGAAWINPSWLRAEGGNKLRVVGVGVGGQGGHDIVQVAEHADTTIVGVVDVDLNSAERAAGRFDCDYWQDYREAFRALGDGFDAVVVSTPDHMHAPIAMSAMNMDKHVYCQKPLTWCVAESRALSAAAQTKGHLATQMGTQIASAAHKRRSVRALEEGVIGKIRAIHCWSDRPNNWWPQGTERAQGEDPVPENLDWDKWIGVAPMRPFKNNTYAPFRWRGVKDFGCGAIGDMACHIADTPFYALGLTNPLSVIAHCDDATDDKYPSKQVVEMVFAGSDMTTDDTLPLTWYDGGNMPDPEALGLPAGFELAQNSCALIGENGIFIVPYILPSGVEHSTLVVNGEATPYEGNTRLRARNHYHHWVDACMGWGETETHFAFASKLTESFLIGAVASRFPGQSLDWDADNMRFTNLDAANAFVGREYRAGWEVENL
ncbi:MAG: Gfo/Idh/MocA family oxidoreductase [Planctomycetota bacterium]